MKCFLQISIRKKWFLSEYLEGWLCRLFAMTNTCIIWSPMWCLGMYTHSHSHIYVARIAWLNISSLNYSCIFATHFLINSTWFSLKLFMLLFCLVMSGLLIQIQVSCSDLYSEFEKINRGRDKSRANKKKKTFVNLIFDFKKSSDDH